MLASFSDFRWHVFSGGYKWRECIGPDGKTLRFVGPNWEKEGYLVERYPLEAPALHRTFAGLELTEKSILSFADEWGPLENAHEFELEDSGDDTVEMTASVGDPTDFWFTEIKRMKALVELWDVLKGGKEKKLSEVIDLQQSGDETLWYVEIAFKHVPELRRHFEFSERNWPGFSDLLEMGGTRELARMCLLELVNDSLWGTCSPWLDMGENPGKVTLRFTPHNLDAALWLMFAQEILGEKNLKQCLFCQGYFETVKDGEERRQRNDKKYCSPKCRAAAFRKRVETSPDTEDKKS